VLWGWPDILWFEVNNYLPIGLTIYKKSLLKALFIGWRGDILKNHGPLCVVRDDLAFGKFLALKFPTFSLEGIETKYFEELILHLIEFCSSNGFAYLSIFLEI